VSSPAYGAPPAAPRRGHATLILSIVAGLLVVLGAVMGGLYVSKNNELSSTRQELTAKVADRDSTISTKEKDIGKLKADLEKAKADLADTKQTLTGTQKDRDQIEKEKQVISRCLQLFANSMTAALAGNRAEVNRLSSDLDKTCNEAEKYL
jgi:chromosome segregation ATPase